MARKWTSITLLVLLAVAAFLTIMQLTETTPASESVFEQYSPIEPFRDEVPVRFATNWFHGAEFAGFYVAEKNGLYDELKLDVEFVEYKFGCDIAESLSSGVVDFALLSTPCFAGTSSDNLDIVAIAAIFQVEPAVFIVMDGSGIETVKDFVGKSIIVKNPYWERIIDRVLQAADISPDRVVKDRGAVDIKRFLLGEVDIWTGYAQNEPVEVDLSGYASKTIYAFDYGLNDYEGIIFTRSDIISERPDIVTAFLSASLRGWNIVVTNPELGLDAVDTFTTGLSIPFQRRSIRELIPYISTGIAPTGWIDSERWRTSCARWGIKNPDKYYTDSFLRRVYTERYLEIGNVLVDK
ncbi:hypothetical protein DRQ36_03340 [bacterium]|nr:MAG: hypothetical protein DRQ36_03340 [bacterium]